MLFGGLIVAGCMNLMISYIRTPSETLRCMTAFYHVDNQIACFHLVHYYISTIKYDLLFFDTIY